MAGSIEIRQWLDLIEAIQTPWGISKSSLFDASVTEMTARVPDLAAKVKRFIDIKLPNPLNRDALVGKHDRPFTGAMVGYWHCHVATDAILIYRLENRSVQLCLVCQHKDLEGKRLGVTVKRLRAATI